MDSKDDDPNQCFAQLSVYRLQKEAPTPKKVEPSKPIISKSEFCDNDYHGSLSNLEATKLLTHEGQYLVRKSSGSCNEYYTLSLRFNNKVHNYKLFYEKGNFYVKKERLFSSVHDLVADGLVTLYIELHAGQYISGMHGGCDYESSPHFTLNRMKREKTIPPIVKEVENLLGEDVTKSHSFKVHNFKGLNWCEYCGNFLWGFTAQGVRCEDCGFAAHNKCSEKVPKDCCPDLKQSRGVFGIDLETLVKSHQTARPFVIDKCIQEIEKRGLNVEGLYRVSGFSEEVEALKMAFDKDGEKTKLSTALYDNIHVLTGALKLYLRLLPIPLITYEVHPVIIKALKESAESDKLKKIKDALGLLPPAHYETLRYLIEHLQKVVERHEYTKMTTLNMATVFAPTLMPVPDLTNGIPSVINEITALEKIITHHLLLFK
ncbi:hypothetical protein RUM43_000610 [Polyplax serrata]|uniref:Beta-chimaerin n=1 Tax=Polyplax serrata TaxID=468196 RepID=A0AAN8SCP1_POLSC